MKVDKALKVAALVAAAAVTAVTIGDTRAVSSSGSKKKVDAVVDNVSKKVVSHAVKKREREEDAWQDDIESSCSSDFRKCVEEPIRPYLPSCTVFMMFDCNSNGIMDYNEIAAGALDVDSDHVLDSCERAVGDFNLDSVINEIDQAMLLVQWGAVSLTGATYGDLNNDGFVDAMDLGILLGRFGLVVFFDHGNGE